MQLETITHAQRTLCRYLPPPMFEICLFSRLSFAGSAFVVATPCIAHRTAVPFG